MFPPAVPNDPLVPTAVLGETYGMIGSLRITHHHLKAPVFAASCCTSVRHYVGPNLVFKCPLKMFHYILQCTVDSLA